MKIGYIIASNQVTREGKVIGYLYREEPDNEGDSGWRAFSGEENEEYAADPTNFAIYNASTIVELDPSVRPLLGLDYPISFERDDSNGEFVEISEDN